MNDRDQIRNFEYRPYRMRTGFAVRFFVGAATLNGLCWDVSDAGIRAEFDGSLVIGDIGMLLLLHPAGQLNLKAKAAYIEKCQVGLVFLFQNDMERQRTSDFVVSIGLHNSSSMLLEFR